MQYHCSVCKEIISKNVYDYSMQHNGAALCLNHQKTVTPQAVKLFNALNDLDVKHQLEYDDGFKHVDIAIEWAKIYLELDQEPLIDQGFVRRFIQHVPHQNHHWR